MLKNKFKLRPRNQMLFKHAKQIYFCISTEHPKHRRNSHNILSENFGAKRSAQVIADMFSTLVQKQAPYYTFKHLKEPVQRAKQNLDWNHPSWSNFTFTCEKFNLCGQDSLSSFWQDVGREPDVV